MISVIMPVYNAEKYLRECIISILSQTLDDFEFLIYNDGSTDSSDAIIRTFDDRRINYKFFNKNRGYLKLLNLGLDESCGRYIARMDADDIALPERFAEQVNYMDEHPDVGICGTWIEFIGSKMGLEKRPVSYEEVRYSLFFGCPLTHPTVMMRTSMLRRYKLYYDPIYYFAEDHDFFAKACRYFPVVNISKPLLKYRLHDEQIGSAKWMQQYEKMTMIQAKLVTAVFPKPTIKQVSWLFHFLTEQSSPGKKWDHEINIYFEELLLANLNERIYPPKIFEDALKILFPQKRTKNISAYYHRQYYNGGQYNLQLLFSFINEPYNPLCYLGWKRSLFFIIKCLIRYKGTVIS